MKVRIETAEVNWTETTEVKRMEDIPGNESAKRALEVALTGGHSVAIMSSIGSPASDLLKTAARIAKEYNLPFKGKVIPVCPCGAYGTAKHECACSNAVLTAYAKSIMPLFRGVPIIIETYQPTVNDCNDRHREPEQMIVARILRYQPIAKSKAIPTTILPNTNTGDLLASAQKEIGVNRDQAIAVGATIACMSGYQSLEAQHIAEAIQYQMPVTHRQYDEMAEIEVKEKE